MAKKTVASNTGKLLRRAGNRKNHPVNNGSFKKGCDSRRNVHGQRNAGVVAFYKQLRELKLRCSWLP